LKIRTLLSNLAWGLLALAAPLAAQQTQTTSVVDMLPPPLPLDASGKPMAIPKSNLERPDFSKAIFVDAIGPTLKSAASIRKLVQDCRDLGFDTIVAQVRSYGDAYYQSQVVPRASDLKQDLDPLKTLLDEAHNGLPRIKVQALISALRVATKDQPLPNKHILTEHRDWLTKTSDGSEEVGENKNEYWLDPGVVAVQDHIALVAAEIARNYPLDGIQMERVRLPDVSLNCGYNEQALQRYKAETGAANKPNPKDPQWIEWRRKQLTELMRKTREAVKAARADVEFSATAITYGAPPRNREEFISKSTPATFALCDWQGWAEQGIVDSVALTDYKAAETRAGDFEGWMNFALANKGKAKVTVVVGGWLNNSRLTAAMMLLPIFDPRADGVGLYSYHSPAAPPETPETAFSVIKAVLHKDNVERRAAKLVDALAKPLTTDHATALVRLNQIAAVLGGASAAQTAAASASTPPPLSAAQTAAGSKTDLPSLGAAQVTTAQQIPSLESAASSNAPPAMPPSATAQTSLPPLKSAAEAAASRTSLPPLGAAASAPSSSAPTLPASGESASVSQAAKAAPSLPPLEQAAIAPTSAQEAQPPTLPVLGQTGSPAISEGAPQALALPVLGQSAESAPSSAVPAMPPTLPTLSPTGAAQTAPATAPAPPGIPAPTASTTVAGEAAPPPLPLLGAPTAQPMQELPVTQPSAAAPQLSAPPPLGQPPALQPSEAQAPASAPAAPSAPDLAEKFARMGIPTEETRGSITIPGSTGETNLGPAAVSTPAPVPTFVAPSVLTPVSATPTPAPVDVMALMPTPRHIDRSNTNESPFIKSTPVLGPRNYAVAPQTSSASAGAGLASGAELIILKNGNQFVGQVIERGATWRIQLPNGSKITIPANKVAGSRPVATMPQ
jgi:uncharacterized lipoprotein YddW (UPF0748 family)